MASIISAGTTTGTALNLSGDTTGNLAFTTQAGANTITVPNVTGNIVVAGQNSAITAGTAQATTSGTSISFTGIPSWVKRITIMFNGNSTNGSSNRLIQIGSGSTTTSGYTSSSFAATNSPPATTNSSSGFVMWVDSASFTLSGHMVLTNVSGNIWVSSHVGKVSLTQAVMGGGDVTLSGTLDRVIITTVNGTDAFDAGSINILYE
jgi:hypothetical protein